jgi:hypothetical protein
MGSKNVYKLTAPLVQKLHAKDILSIKYAKSQSPHVRCKSGWKTSAELGLEGKYVIDLN